MVESEERLPKFVRERSIEAWDNSPYNCKMETPVTFFYVDKPMTVNVNVEMKHGILTHWYPPVHHFEPSPRASESKPPRDSLLRWGRLQVIPENAIGPKAAVGVPPVSSDDSWRFCRETDSAYVRKTVGSYVGNAKVETVETEKFLFYRGVGEYALPLEIKSTGADDSGALTLHNTGKDALHGVVALAVDKQGIGFLRIGEMAGGDRRTVSLSDVGRNRLNLPVGVPAAKNAVEATLVASGLYPKEARAMVNTWELSYFTTPGVRVLYQLPRSTTDAIIPLTVSPKPTETVRVMVGRVEVLTPSTERRLMAWVKDLTAKSDERRLTAEKELASLGRLRAPILLRIAVVGDDDARKIVVKILEADKKPAGQARR
jgi:hypothetical protein